MLLVERQENWNAAKRGGRWFKYSAKEEEEEDKSPITVISRPFPSPLDSEFVEDAD